MSQPRRKCKLWDSKNRKIDLRQYEDLIIQTINETVPGKNPKVFEDYYSTDILTKGESIRIGRALSKIPQLKQYGKEVTIFRLFDGKNYDGEDSSEPSTPTHGTSKTNKQPKGGRMQ